MKFQRLIFFILSTFLLYICNPLSVECCAELLYHSPVLLNTINSPIKKEARLF